MSTQGATENASSATRHSGVLRWLVLRTRGHTAMETSLEKKFCSRSSTQPTTTDCTSTGFDDSIAARPRADVAQRRKRTLR